MFFVAALYRFFPIDDCYSLAVDLRNLCKKLHIQGTLILAPEGINGTVAGSESCVQSLLLFLKDLSGFEGAEIKFSSAVERPFYRMKVRVKKEIVTMGKPGLNFDYEAGEYVEPLAWNHLISDPNTFVLDTRNDYEYFLGSFRGAVDPKIKTFVEFPHWVEKHYDTLKNRKIAMFCTGGIRCEKATAHLKSVGMNDVFHLKGGILKYLEEIPEGESLWNGECFVFDQRVAVQHNLRLGVSSLCYACRHPLLSEDKLSDSYVKGISCPYCIHLRCDSDRKRYQQREKQILLAKNRGISHIGSS